MGGKPKAKKETPQQAEYVLDSVNVRRHTDRNREAIERALKELGAGRSIVVDADGVVIGGNAVYEEAVKLGLPMEEIESDGSKLIVVRRVDLSKDDPKRKLLAIADNKIGDLSEFDYPALADLLRQIKEETDLPLEISGLADFEIGPLLVGSFTPPAIGQMPTSTGKGGKTVVCPECGHEFEA